MMLNRTESLDYSTCDEAEEPSRDDPREAPRPVGRCVKIPAPARVREAEPESLDLFSTDHVGNSPRYKPTAGPFMLTFTTMHAAACMHQLKGGFAVYGTVAARRYAYDLRSHVAAGSRQCTGFGVVDLKQVWLMLHHGHVHMRQGHTVCALTGYACVMATRWKLYMSL